MLGACGACIAVVQSLAMDLGPMRRAPWDAAMCGYILGFVACLFLMYVNTSLFLQSGDSTFFNLSLLTSDVYAVVFSYLLTGELVPWLYFVGFASVLLGLGLYHSAKRPVDIDSESVIAAEGTAAAGVSTVGEGALKGIYNPLSSGNGARFEGAGDEEDAFE